MKRIVAFTTLSIILWCVASTNAQDPTPARAKFEAVFSDWKAVLEKLRLIEATSQQAEDDELAKLSADFKTLLEEGEKLIPKMRDAAVDVYKEAPNEDRQIAEWLANISSDFVQADRFDEAWPAISALIDGKAEDPVLYNDAGIVAFAKHDFEKAKEYFTRAAAAGVLTGQSQSMLLEVENYLQYWEREKELIEKADALKDDDRLPRVRMETNKGTMIIELFEDEAPGTVGNFLSLVENNFYDGLTFHRVLPGFMAQTGCPDGNGGGGPGYEIFSEYPRPNSRKHFTGTLSMANIGRDTGGSQFFITFLPAPHLNGKHTAFGRVIEGLDVLAKIKRRNPEKSTDLAITPDKIIKIEVLNKRDHAYVPNKVR